MIRNRKTDERAALRAQFWPKERAWTGENKKGWFRAPRTLPLLLQLLREKSVSGRQSPAPAYLALWARHFDGGVIEILNELEMAYDSGYQGSRALRTWRERMALLETLGFIKSERIANQPYRYVLLLEPAMIVEKLAKQDLVDHEWRSTYEARRLQTGEHAPKAPVVAMPRALKASGK